MDDLARLDELLLQKNALVIIKSHEEQRILAMLERFALLNGRHVSRWSVTSGLLDGHLRERAYNTEAIEDALRHIRTSPSGSIYVFLDAHHFISNPVVIRLIKDLAEQNANRMLVFITPEFEIPEDLKRAAAVFEPSLPSRERVCEILREEARQWHARSGEKVSATRQSISLLTQHLCGLTESDIRKLCRMSIHDDGALTADDIGRVLRQKHQSLKSAELLTLETDVPTLDQIGGLERLKKWLQVRRDIFIDPDASPGLPALGSCPYSNSTSASFTESTTARARPTCATPWPLPGRWPLACCGSTRSRRGWRLTAAIATAASRGACWPPC